MNKLKILSILVAISFLLGSCYVDTVEIKESKKKNKIRTVLVYIAGDNSLGSSEFDLKDINEMMEGMKEIDPSVNNLLLYWAPYNASAPKLIRFTKDKRNQVIQETVTEFPGQNAVDKSAMKEVFSIAFSEYPADSYGLVLWSHGEGWIPSPSGLTRWWGQDGNKYMDILTLHEALKSAPHFDYILFDACYMQSAEVVYELRDCADYFIGSPTEIPGPGAPYDVVVPAMFTGRNAAIEVAQSYYNVYAQKYNGGNGISNNNWTGGVSLSVVSASRMEALASSAKSIISEWNVNDQIIPRDRILCYDIYRNRNYYDLDRTMQTMSTDGTSYKNFKSVFDTAVIWAKTTEKNYLAGGGMVSMSGFSGLSHYIPYGEYNSVQNIYYRDKLQWYSAAGWASAGW